MGEKKTNSSASISEESAAPRTQDPRCFQRCALFCPFFIEKIFSGKIWTKWVPPFFAIHLVRVQIRCNWWRIMAGCAYRSFQAYALTYSGRRVSSGQFLYIYRSPVGEMLVILWAALIRDIRFELHCWYFAGVVLLASVLAFFWKNFIGKRVSKFFWSSEPCGS